MHAKVSVGVGIHSKLKGLTVFLEDFQIRILNFMKIQVLQWVPMEEAILRGVLQGCQNDQKSCWKIVWLNIQTHFSDYELTNWRAYNKAFCFVQLLCVMVQSTYRQGEGLVFHIHIVMWRAPRLKLGHLKGNKFYFPHNFMYKSIQQILAW